MMQSGLDLGPSVQQERVVGNDVDPGFDVLQGRGISLGSQIVLGHEDSKFEVV